MKSSQQYFFEVEAILGIPVTQISGENRPTALAWTKANFARKSAYRIQNREKELVYKAFSCCLSAWTANARFLLTPSAI
jgi:hypothetical protein